MSTQHYVSYIGLLRIVLLLSSIVLLILLPKPGSEVSYSGWPLITTLIVPVLTPLMFLVWLLDALMAGVLMSGEGGVRRTRYRRIMLADLAIAATMAAFIIPFLLALTR